MVFYCGRVAPDAGGGAARAGPPVVAGGRRTGVVGAPLGCAASAAAGATGSVMMLTGGIEAAEGKSIGFVGDAEKLPVCCGSGAETAATGVDF